MKEINPEELRRGNIVSLELGGGFKPKMGIIKEILEDRISYDRYFVPPLNTEPKDRFKALYCYVKGIPLTKEWLIKFGFKYTEQGWYYLRFGDNSITINIKGNRTVLGSRKAVREAWNIDLNHALQVHQLQNLFYVIEGKELEIK